MQKNKFKQRLSLITLTLLLLSVPSVATIANDRLPGDELFVKQTYYHVPVIMYHMISDEVVKNDLVITPRAFEDDLKYLSENNYNTVFISDLIDFVYMDRPLPENPIVLTFDDGFFNNYVYALPLIEKYDMKMNLSIIGESTEIWSKADYTDKKYGHLSWPQVNEMISSGHVELANHTYKLHKNSRRKGAARVKGESTESYKEVLSKDILFLQTLIQENCGQSPACFTYPYGSISKGSNEIMKELGFKATLSCASGMNIIEYGNADCLFSLKRYNRSANKPVSTILSSIEKKTAKDKG